MSLYLFINSTLPIEVILGVEERFQISLDTLRRIDKFECIRIHSSIKHQMGHLIQMEHRF